MTPPQAFRRRSASTPQTSGVRDRPGLLFLETQGLLLKNFQSLFMLFFFEVLLNLYCFARYALLFMPVII